MMINIDQVRTLEQKVKQTVQLISNLKSENNFLRSKLADYEVRIQELENLLNSFKDSQTEIEAGIVQALEQLHKIDEVDAATQGGSTEVIELVPPHDASLVDVETPAIKDEPVSSSQEEEIGLDKDSDSPEADFQFDSRPAETEEIPLETSPDSHEDDQQQGLGIF